jgi:hypothetical protein
MIQNESQRPRSAAGQLKSGTSFGLVILPGLRRAGPRWRLTLRLHARSDIPDDPYRRRPLPVRLRRSGAAKTAK